MDEVLCPSYSGMYSKGNIIQRIAFTQKHAVVLFEIFQIFSAALFGYRTTSNLSQKGPMIITSLVDSDFAIMLFCHCHCKMSCHLYHLLGGRRREKWILKILRLPFKWI